MFASLLGCLLYSHVTRITGSWIGGSCAVLLFASSSYVLAWFPLVKTYSLSTLLLFGAYVALWDASDRRRLALSGLLLGLSIDTRLYIAAVIPILVFCIYFHRTALPKLATSYGWFFGGLAVGLAPNMFFALHDPASYVFDNLGYHALRSGEGLVGGYHQKIGMLLKIMGLYPTPEGYGWPFGLLVLLNILSFTLHRKLPGPRGWPATYLAATLILTSLLPTPALYQYFCVAVPFLIVGAVAFAWKYAFSTVRIATIMILLILYISPMPFELSRYLSNGVGVIGIYSAENAINYRMNSVRQVSTEIDRQTRPGESVLSLWPGYLVESRARCLPGMESHVGLFIAPRLSPDALERYRILSQSGIERGLAHHDPCLVVLGNEETMHPYGPLYQKMVERYGYQVVHHLGNASIYKCKP